MFKDGFRAFKDLSSENYLPQISADCGHKVDSFVLKLSGISDKESQILFRELGVFEAKEFQLTEIQKLPPRVISEVAGGTLSHSLIIWALLKRLIESHNRNCDSVSPRSTEYVEVVELQSLHGDISISELGLSVRSNNALSREGVHSLFQLSQIPQSELFAMKNLGVRSVNEIIALLEKMGIPSTQESERKPANLLTSTVSLENLDLSTRAYNALKRIGIQNLGALSNLSDADLRDLRNFGEKSIREVKELLAQRALDEQESNLDIHQVSEVSADDYYEWVRPELVREIDDLNARVKSYGHLKLDYQTIGNSSNARKNYTFYVDCETLSGVIFKLYSQLRSALTNSAIDGLILNLDTFTRDFLSYETFYLESMPSKSQRQSLLRYENEYSDDSVDLLKFDDFTLRLLGGSSADKALFLGKESYFELLDSLTEYFVLDESVWNIIKGALIFHEKHCTFPNILGLIIAHHLGSDVEKKEVERELTFLFETLRPNSAERDFRILQLRLGGATLDEIGRDIGVTRERVRQILLKISPELMSTIEVLKYAVHQKQEDFVERKFEDIFKKYGAIYKSELATEIGVSEEEALKLCPKKFNKFIIDKFPEPVIHLSWSKEDCLEALRKAGTYYFPMRQADYDHLVRIGEVKGPSVAYMYLKFGQWSELCVEAGVEFVPSLRSEYVRMWSDEELLSYATRFYRELDNSGSYGGYESWRELQTDHVPSGVLIRNVFGSWTTVKRKVLESLRIEKGLRVRDDV
jgi:hypothetical protein